MQSNNAQLELSDGHEKGYQRQQESLTAMAATSEKMQTVSADMMIENLLKNSFKKLPEMPTTVEQLDHSYAELPLWLQYNNAAVPAHYKYLWSLVQSTVDLADTQKVSQLLLTSGLQVDVLGFIWSLANKTIPGQLTKQEFYIVLALVSLVQSGYKFNNLSILKLLTVPSMPILQLGLLKFPVPQSSTLQIGDTTSFNSSREFSGLKPKPLLNLIEDKGRDGFNNSEDNKILASNRMKNTVSLREGGETDFAVSTVSKSPKPHLIEHTKDLQKNSNFPCIGLSPTAELEDDFSAFQSVSPEKDGDCKKVSQSIYDSYDDFSDFQSANIEHVDPFETVVINQKREIPKIPLPKTLTGKLTGMKSNILKISPESGKKLKVLSAAESLSSLPESKISSNNKVSTSIPVLGSNLGIGSRLANHSYSSQFEVPQQTTKCHKHHKIQINLNSPPSEVLLGVKTKNLEAVIPKCCPQKSKAYRTFVLKETRIRNDDAAESIDSEKFGNESDSPGIHSGEKTRQIEIPMLGTFNETVLPTQSKPQISNVDLITVQEDKYSALREIELEFNRAKNSDVNEINDDFGDFLSADISAHAVSECPQFLVEASESNSDLLFLKNDDKDGWGDWNFNTEASLKSSNISSARDLLTNDFICTDSATAFSTENDLFEPFNLLTFNDNVKEESQSNCFLSNQQDGFSGDSKSDGSDDAVVFGAKCEKLNDVSSQLRQDENINNSDNEFWDFLSSDSKPPIVAPSSRPDYLPQLDSNTSLSDESEQEIIWKKCIDSCHNLIQKGFNIFNSVVTKSVLDEVFAAPETQIYLNNLNIVCQISKRVSRNFSAFPTAQSELEKLWGRLQELCFEYNIKLKPDEDNFLEGKFRCGICLMYVGQDIVNQGSNSYHPSCANLWVNYIEGILPS